MTTAPWPAIAIALGVAVLLAACEVGGTSSASRSPSSTPTPTPTPVVTPDPDALEHPTGAVDVILRVSLQGGRVRMEDVMSRVPLFTLYGDGRVLLMPADAIEGRLTGGPPRAIAWPALREVRLSEAEVQDVLAYALVDGGLGIAREDYAVMVMDAPSTIIEIHAGGVDKTVTVKALIAEPPPGPDAGAMRAFSQLQGRLQAISTGADFTPEAYLAVIAETEPDPANPAVAWPWKDLPPAAFVQPAEADPVPFPRHVLTAAQVGMLGLDVGPGGAAGLRFAGPDGKAYTVAVRPALPDEVAGG